MENKIAIDLMTEDDFMNAPISDLEFFQTEFSRMVDVIRAKQAMLAKVTELKQDAIDAAKKSAPLSDKQKEAMKAHFAAEDKIKNSDMSDDEKAAALAALNNPTEKPPAQNLIGDHITKDNDQVNPAGV